MTRILFFGDSLTDGDRDKTYNTPNYRGSYGNAFPIHVTANLARINPNKYEIYNRGISGQRIVDLYARIKSDVWNLEPDVLSILIGINDIWHEVDFQNGVDVYRYEKLYRLIIEDTLKVLPNVKIILCEPFVLEGRATKNTEAQPNRFEKFCEVKEYAKVVKKLAEEYNLPFLALQEKFNNLAKKYGNETVVSDGVHPLVPGATLIADEWVKLFRQHVDCD